METCCWLSLLKVITAPHYYSSDKRVHISNKQATTSQLRPPRFHQGSKQQAGPFYVQRLIRYRHVQKKGNIKEKFHQFRTL